MEGSTTNSRWIFAWPLATVPQHASVRFPEVELHQNRHWQWGSLHGLQVAAAEIQARLARLQAPALLIYLCAGAFWRIQWFPVGEPPLVLTHHWKTGCSEPHSHLLEQGLSALGLQVPENLRQFLEGPPDPLVAQTPLGNLPHVLQILDLPDVFQGCEALHEQAHATRQYQRQADLAQSGCTAQVMARVAALAPLPLAEGPLILPFQTLSQLYRLAWLADDAASPVIILQGNHIQDTIGWPPGGASHLEKSPAGIHIGLDLSAQPFKAFRWLDEALTWLEPLLTEGLTWQLAIAPIPLEPDDENPANPAAVQLYRGNVLEQAQLAITSTFPALGVSELQRALSLAVWADQGGRWTFPDPAAAQAFVDKARAIGEFYSAALTQEGLDIWLDHSDPNDGWAERHFVARQIFLEGFGEVWDLSVSRTLYLDTEEDPDTWQQLGRQLRQAIQKPHTGEVLLQGKSGTFWQGAAQGLTGGQQQALHLATAELQHLQFQILGDCVWEPGGDVFMRVFKHVQQPAYAVVLLSFFGCFTEFASYFEGGATLTTSPLGNLHHQPEKQVFKYSHADTLPADLWQVHLQHVSAFGRTPKPTASTLSAFLAQLHEIILV
jgi:hypothetical protein